MLSLTSGLQCPGFGTLIRAGPLGLCHTILALQHLLLAAEPGRGHPHPPGWVQVGDDLDCVRVGGGLSAGDYPAAGPIIHIYATPSFCSWPRTCWPPHPGGAPAAGLGGIVGCSVPDRRLIPVFVFSTKEPHDFKVRASGVSFE
jgi:hypothetical protein